MTRAAILVLALVGAVSVLGGALAPHDPLAQDVAHTFAPSGTAGHVLGTDYLGRDVLSRLVAGAAPSVLSALAMVAVGLVLGALPGVLSAFAGRGTEAVLTRFTDSLMSLPPIVFAIAVAGLFANGLVAAIVAIGVLLAPRFFRIARAEALGYARLQYVEAAALLGASRWWIVRRHVARKVLPTIAVTTATSAGHAVLAAASLGFLGLGVQAPDPTWGGMLASDVEYLAEDRFAPLWPGLAIALTVWALNALADGLRSETRSEDVEPVAEPRPARVEVAA
jgi:peptide/nickel transport system permease protein